MKGLLKNTFIVFVLLFAVVQLNSQPSGKNDAYLGIGCGLDYGGIFGGKIEYLPVKQVGLFGGAGFNLLSLGWNVGGTFKMLPQNRISPNFMVFYGYNAVFVGVDNYASKYNATSYGVTFGLNLDLKLGSSGNKFSFGLFIPLRSKEFKDNYNDVINDPNLKIHNELLPVTISFGFNFALQKDRTNYTEDN